MEIIDLPPLNMAALSKAGISPEAIPAYPFASKSYTLTPKKKKPKKERAFTYDECIRLFGTKEAVLMNFVPQMLTALALKQAEMFIDYCRNNRLAEYKRHNREMRKCIEEYNRELRNSYGKSWFAYQNYFERLLSTIQLDLFQCWCTFTNEASRQCKDRPHKDIPARITFIKMLLTYVETLDKNIDKVVASRLNMPCSRKQDPYCLLISALCIDIAETFGHKMNITETMAICVKVLANRCRKVVDDIMADEDASSGI